MTKHILYTKSNQDANIPDNIIDRNGDIVLDMCKVCRAAEIELIKYPECPMPENAR